MPPVTESIFSKYYYHYGFCIIGVGTPVVSNYYNKRPWFAGIQRHFAFGIAGLILGHYVDKFLKRRFAERDAMVKHYIELHPEDFEVKRRKYKEIFDEWYPQR